MALDIALISNATASLGQVVAKRLDQSESSRLISSTGLLKAFQFLSRRV